MNKELSFVEKLAIAALGILTLCLTALSISFVAILWQRIMEGC